MTSHLAENLATLEAETVRLVRTVAAMDDEDVRAPSRCAGWTRAHVISHVARNADGMGNLVHWALTGERREQYASPQSRDADIEAGATRGARELLTDLEDSAARFDALARRLPGPAEDAEVEGRGGRTMRGRDLVTARLREVVFHHVDLDRGYTFADTDPGVVLRAMGETVRRIGAAERAPSLTLRSDEGEEWTVGTGAQRVSGTRAALLLWLARGVPDGLRHERPLPGLPPWG